MNRAPIAASSFRILGVLPNLLSLARLAAGLAFPWVPTDWQIGVVVAAAISDLLDGALSRLMHATSPAGRVLDPVADKIFAVNVLINLHIHHQIATWQIVLVAARDLAVVAGVLWVCLGKGMSCIRNMPPSWLGKITTALQLVFILTVLYWQTVIMPLFVLTAL